MYKYSKQRMPRISSLLTVSLLLAGAGDFLDDTAARLLLLQLGVAHPVRAGHSLRTLVRGFLGFNGRSRVFSAATLLLVIGERDGTEAGITVAVQMAQAVVQALHLIIWGIFKGNKWKELK